MLKSLENILLKNLKNKDEEARRLFHGRGNLYKGLEFLTVDSFDDMLFICFFEQIDKNLEDSIIGLLKTISQDYKYKTIILQRRYLQKDIYELIEGNIEEDSYIIENGLKYNISFKNQNIGIFLDMKIGREYVSSICKDKNVLNLFSYTCAFSVSAINSGAKKVVNVDMSKGALSIGRENHHLNNLDTKKVKFMPYNILKSWSRIKKEAPYDIIIIDPPSFQKGSFAVTKDYEKIIKKLNNLANQNCIVLACLNDPKLDSVFLINKFNTFLPNFKFQKKLKNLDEFASFDEENSLKNLVFQKTS